MLGKYSSISGVYLGFLLIVMSALACSKFSSSPEPATSEGGTPSNSAAAAPAKTETSKKDIAGTYDATGTNPDGGSVYNATLVVTPRDDVYQFSWESGGNKYDGVGVMTDNTAAVSFTDGTNGKGCGVVLYKIGTDGSLDGRSGYWGMNSGETEKGIRKNGSGDLEGSYDITGKNVQGDYKGTLEVRKDGEGYAFSWDAGLTGFGIKQGDKAVVGFGGKQCAFVAYEVKPDGSLQGKWGSQGSTKFGTETAKLRK